MPPPYQRLILRVGPRTAAEVVRAVEMDLAPLITMTSPLPMTIRPDRARYEDGMLILEAGVPESIEA